MAGLPEDFALRTDEVPRPAKTDEPGRALPPGILKQLCDALSGLEKRRGSKLVRIAVELLIDTGRRPDEICKIAWDCLEQDADGKHVLIYDDFKNNRLGRRLPITDATAAVIIEQKKVVRGRFPHTKSSELKLLPPSFRNPHGRRGMSIRNLTATHRRWVDLLPLLRADGTEYDRAAVIPYSYRHSYAQRHADAGVPVDVLRELMGHELITTSQVYYRVGEKRCREAVDRLASHQFDRHGNRVWKQAQALLDHEHARRKLGEVAVPYGGCREPSNVQAGGGACPFRFRCVGCDHFHTDVSYLPDLKAYLQDLRRDRERVLATADLDDWAKTEAGPSEAEINRVKDLVHRVEQHLDELTQEERATIEEAVGVVRRARQVVTLGLPQVRPVQPDLRLERP